jgi:hypothetical protein
METTINMNLVNVPLKVNGDPRPPARLADFPGVLAWTRLLLGDR